MTSKTTARQLVRNVTDAVSGLINAVSKEDSPSPIITIEPMSPPVTKLGCILNLLKRPEGAVLVELMEATGWQAHSIRGAVSSLKKKFGAALVIEKIDGRGRVYRLAGEA